MSSIKKIVDLDLISNYYLRCPSSSCVSACLTNVEVCIYKLRNSLLGAPITLPDYITNSKAIIGLARDESHHRDFDDQNVFSDASLSIKADRFTR